VTRVSFRIAGIRRVYITETSQASKFLPGNTARAHLGTTTGPRLCPKDQPQQVRMPKVAE